MEIVSKFVVGSDQGVDEFFDVKKAFIRNSYQEIVASEIIENYIKEDFDHRKTINVLNDFSNQLIMVFADQQPVGYCFFQTGFSYPEASENQKMTAIKEFSILQEYDLPEVRLSLWKKVRSAIQFADSIWINIRENDSEIQYFKDQKFVFVKDTVSEPFNLPSFIYKLDLKKL
ncbi:hypothetical protein [Chryseobacterium scophthalmum]|uniref:N-acetyltransferase domain-containing protein n=1 Tax=Chryseobacterium scophthalmum TaxID=59733 RepID=A0A1N6FTJ2_9FLAO|nr:hypothetical protein [Chryseobacterium scophthalmum]SIN98584.1 hypothetical protein SAMN05421769_1592 [Chryseobacterium scophthalmum]